MGSAKLSLSIHLVLSCVYVCLSLGVCEFVWDVFVYGLHLPPVDRGWTYATIPSSPRLHLFDQFIWVPSSLGLHLFGQLF